MTKQARSAFDRCAPTTRQVELTEAESERQADVLEASIIASEKLPAVRREMIAEAQNSARAVPRGKGETDFGDQHEAPVRFGLIVEPQTEQLLRVHRSGATTDVQSRIIAIGRAVIGASGEYGPMMMLIMVAGSRTAREVKVPSAMLEFVEADEEADRRVRTIHPARLPNAAAPAPPEM